MADTNPPHSSTPSLPDPETTQFQSVRGDEAYPPTATFQPQGLQEAQTQYLSQQQAAGTQYGRPQPVPVPPRAAVLPAATSATPATTGQRGNYRAAQHHRGAPRGNWRLASLRFQRVPPLLHSQYPTDGGGDRGGASLGRGDGGGAIHKVSRLLADIRGRRLRPAGLARRSAR